MLKISILFSLLGSFAFATDEIASLKGILIVDDSSKVREERLDQIKGIQFDGIENESLEEKLVSEFPFSADGANQLCEAIANHYRETENLRVSVSIPDQNRSEGTLQLVVMPERLGNVNITENRYTKPETLKKWVRLETSDAINEKLLTQDVGWINSNPFRNVNISYQPGSQPGVTDVNLVVSDKKNWKVTTGVENTGTNPIGPTRVFAGVNYNDFIFTDHTLNFQATHSNHFSEYRNYSAQYTAPLPWRNTVRVSGSYTGTFPHRADFPRKHRETFQASGRYQIPQWFASNDWIDQLSFEAGFDFKGTNTNILFEDDAAPVEKRLAFVGQFAGSVNAQRNRNDGKISASVDFIGSPARILPHQTETDFNNLRLGATPVYFYSRMTVAYDQKLANNWKLFAQGRGQFSASNLIPSEQFSLGGYNTVRGYEEKVVNGDNSLCANFEVKTPEFSPAGPWFPKLGDSLQFLGFVDAGYAWYRQAIPDAPLDQALLGVGPGLRYSVASYFTSRFDVGFPLLAVEKDNRNPHIHFNAIFSY